MVEMSTADMTKEINRLEGEISKREARIAELCQELKDEQEKNKDLYELPVEPIAVAEMLINANFECECDSISKAIYKRETNVVERYTSSELRQIAEHLIVYCNHAEKDDEK